jgi:glucokinase
MNPFAIGIDLGGTAIKFALISQNGDILHDHSLPTEADYGAARAIDNVMKGISELLKLNSEKTNSEKLIGIGIGVPGTVSFSGSTTIIGDKIKEWVNIPMGERLKAKLFEQHRLAKPVFVENDANVAALGEAEFGAGKLLTDFVMITLGTGVGGGIILNRKIYRGVTGAAGELGHITIDYKSKVIHAGIPGTIEGLIGQKKITAVAKTMLEQTPSALLLELCGGNPDELEPKFLTEAAMKGDPVAIAVWNYVGEALGAGLGTIASVLDVRKFILGGGVAGAGEFVITPTLAQLRRFTIPAMQEGLEVITATLGNRAGVMGAAAMCF